jgi:hypothetical protein
MATAFSFLRELIDEETSGAIVQGMSGFRLMEDFELFFRRWGDSSSFV